MTTPTVIAIGLIFILAVMLVFALYSDLVKTKSLYKSKTKTELIRELTDELNSYYDEFEYELTDDQKIVLELKIANTKEVLKGLLS